jgi:poly(A) polymerase
MGEANTIPIPAGLRQALVSAAGEFRLAFVGGAVRDLLLHHVHRDPWRGLPDLDLVVEDLPVPASAEDPAAHRLARALQAADPAAVGFCCFHGAYGTVELELQGVLLDLATARSETYPRPAENPSVCSGRLEDDLGRRDFTINAIALMLQPDGGVQLLDPHGGQADLALRCLRLLHEHSLRDDPTRLVRGARYGARLGLILEPGSLAQARRTLAAWPWPWRPGDPPDQAPPALGTRLRMELELLLEREPWPAALALLQAWGGLALFDDGLQADNCWRSRLRRARRLGLPLLPALLAGANDPAALAARLQLPHSQQRWLTQWQALRHSLSVEEHSLAWMPSRWCELLEGHGCSPEAVALALACGDGPRRPLLRWLLNWRHVRAPLTAAELIAREGLRPGPALGKRLRQLRGECLDQPLSAE